MCTLYGVSPPATRTGNRARHGGSDGPVESHASAAARHRCHSVSCPTKQQQSRRLARRTHTQTETVRDKQTDGQTTEPRALVSSQSADELCWRAEQWIPCVPGACRVCVLCAVCDLCSLAVVVRIPPLVVWLGMTCMTLNGRSVELFDEVGSARCRAAAPGPAPLPPPCGSSQRRCSPRTRQQIVAGPGYARTLTTNTTHKHRHRAASDAHRVN